MESVDKAGTDLLKLGADVQVTAPPELVARIGATIRAMAALYPAPGPEPLTAPASPGGSGRGSGGR